MQTSLRSLYPAAVVLSNLREECNAESTPLLAFLVYSSNNSHGVSHMIERTSWLHRLGFLYSTILANATTDTQTQGGEGYNELNRDTSMLK